MYAYKYRCTNIRIMSYIHARAGKLRGRFWFVISKENSWKRRASMCTGSRIQPTITSQTVDVCEFSVSILTCTREPCMVDDHAVCMHAGDIYMYTPHHIFTRCAKKSVLLPCCMIMNWFFDWMYYGMHVCVCTDMFVLHMWMSQCTLQMNTHMI